MKKLLLLLAVILLTSCSADSEENQTQQQTYKYWRITYTIQMNYVRTDVTTKEIYEAHTPEIMYVEDGYNRIYTRE
jgi:outer membrane biogenesis lipoprotein LolB